MNSKQKWADLIDRKVLVTPHDRPGAGPFEYLVKEVSPSGNNIKMENRAGRTFWCKAHEYKIEEILPNEQPNTAS